MPQHLPELPRTCDILSLAKKETRGTKMKIQKFERKTFPVDAVRVTLENMPEVVKWTRGNLQKDDLGRPYVAVEVSRPANEKQTMAYDGDWVLKTATGFRVYTDFAFHKSFDEVRAPKRNRKEESRVDPYQQSPLSAGEQLLKNIFEEPGVDRKVVEEPVGDEKVVQGESVEKRPETDEEFGRRAAKTFRELAPFLDPYAELERHIFRTPQQIRDAHRTGSRGHTRPDGSPINPEDHGPTENVDQVDP
jgi:hypothetical protein